MPTSLRVKIARINAFISSPLAIGLYRVLVFLLSLCAALFAYSGKQWVAKRLDGLLSENPRITALGTLQPQLDTQQAAIGSLTNSVKELAFVTKALQEAQQEQKTSNEALRIWAQSLSEQLKLLKLQVDLQRESDLRRIDELAGRFEKALDRINATRQPSN